nr:YetF domain-containing protein [Bacillus massiliglaciei]
MKFPDQSPATAEMLHLKPEDTSLSYIVIDEGQAQHEELKRIGKDIHWLYAELEELGYPRVEDIFYAEWSKHQGFFIKEYKQEGRHEQQKA